jgi:hypothetical protein
MYRIKVRLSEDGVTVILHPRDVMRLCLGDGDELVVQEVVRHPAHETGEPAAEPAPAAPAVARGNAPLALSRPSAEGLERDKSAFRKLAQ